MESPRACATLEPQGEGDGRESMSGTTHHSIHDCRYIVLAGVPQVQ